MKLLGFIYGQFKYMNSSQIELKMYIYTRMKMINSPTKIPECVSKVFF